jgi:DNA-binding NtrC family response regulator
MAVGSRTPQAYPMPTHNQAGARLRLFWWALRLPRMQEGSLLMVPAVLVVDDDQDVREGVADAVSDSGRAVFTARDGGEALQLLDDPEIPRPCLILLDWLMTPMGGQAFLEQVRGRDDFEQLSILIMSADGAFVPSATLPGVIGTLHKPFELDALLAILDERCPQTTVVVRL